MFGEQNDAIGEKLHRLALALVAARDIEAVVAALHFNLREDFAVPHTVLRLWPEGAHAQLPEFEAASAAARDFADSLGNPYCSAHAMVDTARMVRRGRRASALVCVCRAEERAHAWACLRWRAKTRSAFIPRWGRFTSTRLGELASAAMTGHLT